MGVAPAYRPSAVHGVLLYGPPGCGKTALVHALCRHCQVRPFPVCLSVCACVFPLRAACERTCRGGGRPDDRTPFSLFHNPVTQLPMIRVVPSLLLRKYVGETSAMTKAVFSAAKKLQPCLLFVDEMDALFRERHDGDHHVDRALVTEFMQLWDTLCQGTSRPI